LTPRFPRDLAKSDVLRALAKLGFTVDREHEHIGLKRTVASSTTLLIIPNHKRIKMATLLTACARAGISRNEVLHALESK
jgi:hypothetical protein